VVDPDWRLHGHERHLAAARVRHAQYRSSSEHWDHDHCAFCSLKLSKQADVDVARAGWQTEDGYHWICDTCFADFRERLGFVVDEGAPTRGVELHDAQVLQVDTSAELVVVRLQAFVHDDWTSRSCKGCWQRIDLAFYEASFERHGSGEPWILDGSVQVDDLVTDNMLPIPFHEPGAVLATMAGADFELTVRARRVWLRVAGAPEAREG
jgi:hypothetical protein